MRVPIADIIKKAQELSPDYEKQVKWDGSSTHAEVTSVNAPMDGGDPKVHAVSIKPWKGRDGKVDLDYLDAACPTCPATVLCYHLAMFYGVVKKIGLTDTEPAQDPPASTEEPATAVKPDEAPKLPGSRIQALQLISEGIEKLTDGIAQISRSTARQEVKVVVREEVRAAVEESLREQAIAQEHGHPEA